MDEILDRELLTMRGSVSPTFSTFSNYSHPFQSPEIQISPFPETPIPGMSPHAKLQSRPLEKDMRCEMTRLAEKL